MQKQATCEARIDESLARELDRLREFEACDWDVTSDGAEFDDHALSYEWNADAGRFVYLLSFGGPQTEFRFAVDMVERVAYADVYIKDEPSLETVYECVGITYHYLDWFDGAERKLTGSDYELVQQIFDRYHVC
jgi:hypothetical protein